MCPASSRDAARGPGRQTVIERGAAVSLSLVIMLAAALGAIVLTVAALPAADRFLRW